MSWRQQLAQRTTLQRKEAEEALIMSQIGYADMLNQRAAAERIARGHLKLQRENHFGYKIFGVPVDDD